MAASGNFVSDLRWDKEASRGSSRNYLSTTNLDVITAEACVWIAYLIGQFHAHDEDRKMIGDGTMFNAADTTKSLIKSIAGFDFSARWTESWKLYIQAEKDHTTLVEAFALVVFRSIGCKSLADPLKPASRAHLITPEWAPVRMYVNLEV
jgi:hypothetical protein